MARPMIGNACKFDIEFHFNGHDLRATGVEQPFVPATGPSMENVGGDPADGGELEDLEVYIQRGKKERRLRDALVGKLELDDRIHEAIHEND